MPVIIYYFSVIINVGEFTKTEYINEVSKKGNEKSQKRMNKLLEKHNVIAYSHHGPQDDTMYDFSHFSLHCV